MAETILVTEATGSVGEEVARIFSQVLGRPIRYAKPSPLSFALRMRARRYPWAYIAVMVGIYTTARLGLAATVTPHITQLLGRPPISVQQYVEGYRALVESLVCVASLARARHTGAKEEGAFHVARGGIDAVARALPAEL